MEYPKLHSNKVSLPSRDDFITRMALLVTIHPDIKQHHCHFR